jgi:hypothetical protein
MPRPLLRAAIIAALSAALVLVSGCSAIGLVYKQADTLAFRWLDRYADFDDAQSLRVREAIAAWFSWHRRTQLPDYAEPARQRRGRRAGRHHGRARLHAVVRRCAAASTAASTRRCRDRRSRDVAEAGRN